MDVIFSLDLLQPTTCVGTSKVMNLNHALYGTNLSRFRDPSPNLVIDSYYPIDESGGHSSESSRSTWDSIPVFAFIFI